jgi:hypothetical protein
MNPKAHGGGFRPKKETKSTRTWAWARDGDAPMITIRKRTIRCATILALMAGTSLVPQGVRAQTSVAVVADPGAIANAQTIIQGGQADTNAINQQLQTTEQDLITALKNFSGQETVNSRSAVQAQSQMNDTADARAVQMRVTDTTIRGALATAPGASVCNVITGSVSAQNSFIAVSKWREEIQAQQQDYFTGATPATASSKGLDAAIEQRIENHCAVGATAYDVTTGLCSSVTQQAQALETGDTITPPVGRDLNATILLEPNMLTFTTADKAAANSFLVNALNSSPLGAEPAKSASINNAVGRRVAANNMEATALHSIVQEVGSSIIADMAPMPGTGSTPGNSSTVTGSTTSGSSVTATIQGWAEGTAKQTIGYSQSGTNFPNGVSRAAYFKLRSMAWFWNPNWASQVGIQSGDQSLKDIALIEAWSVYQNWTLSVQVQRMNLTLAAMLSIMEKQGRAPQ